MEKFMKDNLSWIKEKDKEQWCIQMEVHITVYGIKGNKMGKVCLRIKMVKFGLMFG